MSAYGTCVGTERGPMKYVDEKAGIYLRLMTIDDTDCIVNWRNKDAVRKCFVYQELFTRETHMGWIKNMVEPGKVVQMMICELTDDTPIGSVYVRDIDKHHNKAEYGIFIGEDSARGRGIGTAAAKLMVQYCFEELKLHKLFLRAFSDNMQAIRSYEKAGFVQEAYLKDDVCIDGVYRDMVFMAILNPNT